MEFAHEKVEELLANKAVDAVYIAVPNKFHVPLAIDALKAGKHVILEKPFAMNAAEAEHAIATAKAAGAGSEHRHEPAVRRRRAENPAARRAGRAGRHLPRQGLLDAPLRHPETRHVVRHREVAGGGCLYDFGVHMLDLCLYTMGNFEPISVSGATYTKFGNRGLGEGGWGTLRQDRDALRRR